MRYIIGEKPNWISSLAFEITNSPSEKVAVYLDGMRLTEGGKSDYTIYGKVISLNKSSHEHASVLVDYTTEEE